MRDNPGTYSEPALPQEAQLIRQAKSGNTEAFAQLYDAYFERVYRYIYFRVSDDAEAEDLTSQVFLKAWENLDRYQIGRSPYLAWLFTTARNLVIDHYRTKKESIPMDDVAHRIYDDRLTEEQAELRFSLQAMREALQFLTEDQQQVLILKFIVGLPNESIARMLDKREGAIRALQMRALQTLSKYMEEKELT